MRVNRLLALVTAASSLSAAAVVAGVTAGPAQAANSNYVVMNTSEYPPDGIYFRSDSDWNTAVKVTGYGVYAGETVHLQCFKRGANNVPRRDGGSNNVWYVANNLTRAKASDQDPRENKGWINAHFVNDGTGANEVAPGVPECINGAAPGTGPKPAEPKKAVFYAGIGDATPDQSPDAITRKVADWTVPGGKCDFSSAAAGVPLNTTTLAGYSKGRLGPIYFLRHGGPTAMKQIDYVLMIDPGSYSDMADSCDNPAYPNNKSGIRAGAVLADWLGQNDNARLVILSGKYTAEKAGSKREHRGIQEFYFNAIRSAQKKDGIERSSQVLVCNYDGSHKAMFTNANYYIQRARLTTCPQLHNVTQLAPLKGWNPGK